MPSLCPANKHVLDYDGQTCSVCKAKGLVGFKLLLHGELSLRAHPDTAWQLPSMNPEVELDLEKAVRDPAAFEEAALLIGRFVMERARYAARGARQWQERSKRPKQKLSKKKRGALALLARLKG